MKARVHVTFKNGVLDPQGKAVHSALKHLGFDGVENVRQGKYIEIDLKAANTKEAEAAVRDMCEKLLANTIIENYQVEIA